MPTTADILRAEYGLGELMEQEFPSVAISAVTSSEILTPDPNRLSITFINTGTTSIVVRPVGVVSALNGITISPSGGLLSLMWREDTILPTRRWSALALVGAGTMYILTVSSYSRRDGGT